MILKEVLSPIQNNQTIIPQSGNTRSTYMNPNAGKTTRNTSNLCPFCGAPKIDPDSRFCSSCGQNLT